MRGLIIKKPWIDYTLAGKKDFEIRTRSTNIRERIGLICAGTGLVLGEADIVECKQLTDVTLDYYIGFVYREPLLSELLKYINELKTKKAYFWELKNIVRYDNLKKYKHPQGAQMWIKNINFVEEWKDKTNYY